MNFLFAIIIFKVILSTNYENNYTQIVVLSTALARPGTMLSNEGKQLM